MLDEFKSCRGWIEVGATEDQEVTWEDGNLTFHDLTIEEAEQIIQWVKAGPHQVTSELDAIREDPEPPQGMRIRDDLDVSCVTQCSQEVFDELVKDLQETFEEPEPEPAKKPKRKRRTKAEMEAARAAKEAEAARSVPDMLDEIANIGEHVEIGEDGFPVVEDPPYIDGPTDPVEELVDFVTGEIEKEEEPPPALRPQGLDPALIRRAFEAKENALTVDGADPAAKEKVFELLKPEGMEIAPITPEIQSKLEAQVKRLQDMAQKIAKPTRATMPVTGEEYAGELVTDVKYEAMTAVLTLRSLTKVVLDLQTGKELSRVTPEVKDPVALGMTQRVNEVMEHFLNMGMSGEQIIAALEELKVGGHPALQSVDDVAGVARGILGI